MNDAKMFLREKSDGDLAADYTTPDDKAVYLGEGFLVKHHARILIPSMRPGGRITARMHHSRVDPATAVATGGEAPFATMLNAEIAFATHVRPAFQAIYDHAESAAVPTERGEWGFGNSAAAVNDATYANIAAGTFAHFANLDNGDENVRAQLLAIKDDDYFGLMFGPFEWIVWRATGDASGANANRVVIPCTAVSNRTPAAGEGGAVFALGAARKQPARFMHWPNLPAGHHHEVHAAVPMIGPAGWWRCVLDIEPAGSYGAVAVPIGGAESAPQTLAPTLLEPYPNWTRYGIPGPGQSGAP